MSVLQSFRSVLSSKWAIAAFVAAAALVALAAVMRHYARGNGIRWYVSSLLHRGAGLARAIVDSRNVKADNHGDLTSVLFVHHSVGQNLIRQGGLRERLAESGFRLWDQEYNNRGLTGPDGNARGYAYWIPGDNTDPDGYEAIFRQPVHALPWNTLSGILQHEVIVFKSCYPVSDIRDDAALERYRSHYLAIRSTTDAHRDKLFIVVTPPPLNPSATSSAAAARARAFADWLGSPEFLDGHANLFTFDLFGSLEEKDPSSAEAHMLRAEYRDGGDSHPTEAANRAVAPLLADFIAKTARAYRARSAPAQVPTAAAAR